MNEEDIMVLGVNTPIETAIGSWVESKLEEIVEQETVEGKEGHVYFLRNNEYVKIGYSTQIEERISQLQRDFPGAKLLYTIFSNNAFATEKLLHEYFKHKHYIKEWYILNDDDMDMIRQFDGRPEYTCVEQFTVEGNAQIKVLRELDAFILKIQMDKYYGEGYYKKVKNDE